MPGNYCSVPLCDGRGGHKFPKEKTMRFKWLVAVRRDKWTPTDASVVCRRHFRSSDYRTENTSGTHCARPTLMPDIVPSLFSWTSENKYTRQRAERQMRRRQSQKVAVLEKVSTSACDDIASEVVVDEPVSLMEFNDQLCTTLVVDTVTSTADAWRTTEVDIPFDIAKFVFDDDAIHYYRR